MTSNATTIARAGYSDAPQGAERVHSLTVLVEDRPGSVDRVIGVLRRKRAHAQTLALGPAEQTGVVRITAQVRDADVSVDHLVEQVRKIVDVQQVTNVLVQQALTRELALIKVSAANTAAVIEAAQQAGGSIIDQSPDAVVVEAHSDPEQVVQVIAALESYGPCEIVRSGAIAIARS